LSQLSIKRRADWWNQILSDPGSSQKTLVAVIDHVVVGFISFGKERDESGSYQGEVYALYLLQKFHGLGIGRALFENAVRGLLEFGFTNMLLWVLSENPTRKFYAHMGGHFLKEKIIQIGDVDLSESAYVWPDLNSLIRKK
jgi:GNAT superfamily N-acetyltransferase